MDLKPSAELGRQPGKDIEKKVTKSVDQFDVQRNPKLPSEIIDFRDEGINDPYFRLTTDEWVGSLHGTEIKDKLQQIKLRPLFAIGVFVLITIQNVGIWFIVVWALQTNQLASLQFIFGTLVAGTLTQSYFILKFITNKVFSDIDYHNGNPMSRK